MNEQRYRCNAAFPTIDGSGSYVRVETLERVKAERDEAVAALNSLRASLTFAARPKCLDDMTEPELTALFTQVIQCVEAFLPKGTGAIVLAAPLGKPGVAQYVSNVQRSDAAKWMLETVERWANRDHVPRSGH